MTSATQRKMALLFGMPRSGTTWIGKLLDSHPDSYYLHEPDTVFPTYDVPLLTTQTDIDSKQGEVTAWLDEILDNQHQTVTAFPPIFPKRYMTRTQLALFKSTTFISKLNSKAGLPLILKPVRRVNKSESSLIIWKSIESLGRAGLILSICPNAKVLHLIRHPCGHVNSTLQGFSKKKFSTQAPIYEDWDLFDKLITQSGNQQFDLNEVKAMNPEERLALRWGIMNDHCASALPETDSLTIRYEDVCEKPLLETEKMFNWLGLTIELQTEAFVRSSTSQNEDSYYGTTKDPRKSAYSWKKTLTDEQVSNILKMVSNFDSGAFYGQT